MIKKCLTPLLALFLLSSTSFIAPAYATTVNLGLSSPYTTWTDWCDLSINPAGCTGIARVISTNPSSVATISHLFIGKTQEDCPLNIHGIHRIHPTTYAVISTICQVPGGYAGVTAPPCSTLPSHTDVAGQSWLKTYKAPQQSHPANTAIGFRIDFEWTAPPSEEDWQGCAAFVEVLPAGGHSPDPNTSDNELIFTIASL